MTTGERIRILREKNGYTQEYLAGLIGVQKSAFAKYENGRVENIKRSNIKILADALHVSPCYLIFGDESEDEDPAQAIEAHKRDEFVNLLLRLNEENAQKLLEYAQLLLMSQEAGLGSRE